MYLNYSYFPVFTSPLSHPWVLLLKKKMKRKEKKKSSICAIHIVNGAWSSSWWPVP